MLPLPGGRAAWPGWPGSGVGQGERGDATVGKRPPQLHTGILEMFLRVGKNCWHQGAKRGLLDEHGNSKGRRMRSTRQAVGFKVKQFAWGMG